MNDKQDRFAREYLVDLNATQAAIRAGYSQKTAGSAGFSLLQNPEIQAAIQRGKADLAKRTDVSAERVVTELAYLGFSDITQIVQGGGDAGVLTVRDLDSLPESARRCIESVSEVRGPDGSGTLKIKLHSKMAALSKLMDHLGMNAPVKVADADGQPLAGTEAEAWAAVRAIVQRDPSLLGGG